MVRFIKLMIMLLLQIRNGNWSMIAFFFKLLGGGAGAGNQADKDPLYDLCNL